MSAARDDGNAPDPMSEGCVLSCRHMPFRRDVSTCQGPVLAACGSEALGTCRDTVTVEAIWPPSLHL